jgi:pimeloyl-ACP methyl ester carboxylesterase
MPTVTANKMELFYDEAGAADAPVIILIMGLGTQMIAWPDVFVQGLADEGFRVIRFDNRDIGLSTHLDGAKTPNLIWALLATKLGLPVGVAYSLKDMAADTIGLMDALGIKRAHIAGASMGGMIAQNVAALYPDRVLSLISIMSSSGAAGLPGPTPELRKRMMQPRPDASKRAEAIAAGVEMQRMISFPDPARAPDALETLVAAGFDRAYYPIGARRQLLAILTDTGRPARLSKVKAPTLVIHGKADPLVPLANSVDIAKRISGAKLEVIDDMAHDLPPSQIAPMVGLIAQHAKSA